MKLVRSRAPVSTLSRCSALLLWSALLSGCEASAEPHGHAGVGGASAPTVGGGGSAGASSGGSAGASGRGNAGAGESGSAGAAPPGEAGNGGGASEDCATHSDTVHCLSARGELAGRSFDFTCLQDRGLQRIDDLLNEAWSMSCDDSATGISVQASIPKQPPGTFHHRPDEQDPFSTNIEIGDGNALADSGRPNRQSASIDGEVRMEAATGSAPVLSGTFMARFSDSGDGCTPQTCPAGSVVASFRSVFDF